MKTLKIVDNRFKYFIFSSVLIVIGFATLFINVSKGNGAFNYDVQFVGGTSYTINIGKAFNNNDIQKIVTDTTGQKTSEIQKVNGDKQVTIKLKKLTATQRTDFTSKLESKYGLTDAAILSMDDISATISSEIRTNAIMAVIVASIAMLIYISLRFRDFKIGASSILALLHDITIVVLSYAVLRIPLNYSFIAVVLTILGYSINATIVIFDRIRENRRGSLKLDCLELVNKSVTQTITRCIYTSVATLLAVVCLYIFGVQSIKQFTLPILIGIVFGTYSSVCVSGSIWYSFAKNEMVKVKR